MSWQDYADDGDEPDDDTPAITLGDLRAGDEAVLTVDAEPEQFSSDEYGPGVRVEATLGDSNYPFRTEDGDRIEAGEDVVLVTWSKRLVSELVEHAEDVGGIVGETIAITKSGTGYDTQYSVVSA